MTSKIRSAGTVVPPCILIVAVTFGFARYSFGLFLPEIRQEMNLTIAEAGVAVSISYLGYLFASLISSTLSGSVGPRVLVVTGGVLATGGMLLASLAQDEMMLIVGLFAAGMSPGFSYPPLSDAITRLVAERDRDRIYTTVNSGTSIGIIISAPAALLFLNDWRLCLLTFATISAVVTVWNWMILPNGPFTRNSLHDRWPITFRWLVNKHSVPLFVSAFLFGISSSIYWVFSPDLLVNNQGRSQEFVTLFWLLIGLAGLTGALTGQLVHRLGLYQASIVAISAYIISLVIFVMLPNNDAAMLISAAYFGGAFIAVTGIYGVWSMNVFAERPSAGFGTTFLLISVGQFAGPFAGGHLANLVGTDLLFAAAAVVGLICLGFLPKKLHMVTV